MKNIHYPFNAMLCTCLVAMDLTYGIKYYVMQMFVTNYVGHQYAIFLLLYLVTNDSQTCENQNFGKHGKRGVMFLSRFSECWCKIQEFNNMYTVCYRLSSSRQSGNLFLVKCV